MTDSIKEPLIKGAACLIGFFVMFAIAGGFLSHYLFIWLGVASSPSFSETVLWGMFGAFGLVALGLTLITPVHPLEALAYGLLAGVGAGGLFAIGYANILLVLVAALIAGIVIFALKLGPVRAVYVGLCVGLLFSLVPYWVSAVSMSRMKSLSYTTTTSSAVTDASWSAMSETQREGFVVGVIQTEVSRLTIGSVQAYQAILPKDVLATVGTDGSVLVNYAAIRVASPSADTVARYEQTNGIEWIYEDLTCPDDLTEAVVHAVAHIYQQQRVAGEIKEQRTWPYDDADDEDGKNTALETWAKYLPVDPATDVESRDNLLESQAWGYASNRLSDYISS